MIDTAIIIFVVELICFVIYIAIYKKKYGSAVRPKNSLESKAQNNAGQVPETKAMCDVCGKKQIVFTYKDSISGKPIYGLCYDCNNLYKSSVLGHAITIGEMRKPFDLYPQTIDEVRNTISKKAVYRPKEHRMSCKVCGNLFCYSEVDLWNNEVYRDRARQASNAAILGALGGNLLSSDNDSAARDRYRDKIVDYTRCPKCNSTDIVELSENEYAILQERNTTTVLLPTDEIKKYKELLDSGIITQEEFDTKKKQLLGL